MSLWKTEPARIIALVHAALALAIGFGLGITLVQFALIEAFVAVLVGETVRSQVTPVADLTEKLEALDQQPPQPGV